MAGTHSCRPERSESLEEFPGFGFHPVHIRSRIRCYGGMSAFKGTEFHRVSFVTTREFSDDMSAVGRELDFTAGIASIVLGMLQEAIFPAFFLRVILDPFARRG